MKSISLDNSKFFPKVVELIQQGHTVTICARGNSMRPFIEDGRDKLVFGNAIDIKTGDVVLAELHPGHYVCHRVEKIEGDTITMRGDGNVPNKKTKQPGTETFNRSQLRAKLVQIIRKGKTYNISTSKTWHVYSAVWTRLLPARRYLLVIYRLLWKHELPRRLTNALHS